MNIVRDQHYSAAAKTLDSLSYGKLRIYSPPSWMNQLENVPSVRLHLAVIPTPIHKWDLQGVPQNVEVYIKRDDLTGSALTGNKVRKLEFIFADIVQKGCKHVITSGGIISNHCRAVAVIAAQLGIQSHLLLRSRSNKITSNNGNAFLFRMCDANIYLVPIDCKLQTTVKLRTELLAKEILKKTGEMAYEVVGGGSSSLGVFGYLNAWQELMEQGVQDRFDDVVIVVGSGGTVTGLVIGNYLTGQKLKVHAITISLDPAFLHNRINKLMIDIGLGGVHSESIVDIIDGYRGAGYGMSTEEDHNLCKSIAATTGIFCDPIYNGKGVKGLLAELSSSPGRFQGNRILYVHTGGIFGLYDGRMFDIFTDEKVHDWKDVAKSPDSFL